MRIDRYIAQSRVIDIESKDFEGAVTELIKVFDFSNDRNLTKKGLLRELLEREQQMTTYLGGGVCLPHARVKMKRPYMIAVGRCPDGLIYERINAMRLLEGFPEIKPVPRQLVFAASLGLGEDKLENIKIRHVPFLGDAEEEDQMTQIKEPLK